jgi:hypothetical protein
MAAPVVVPKTLPLDFNGWDNAQVHTGANASGAQTTGYAQGVSNPPNDGQVENVNNPPATLPADFNGWDKPAPQPSLTQRLGQGAEDLGKGALEGIGSDVYNAGNAAGELPLIGKYLQPSPEAQEHLRSLITPADTTQKVGRGLEQAGEFLIPGLGEERAAGLAAEHLPQLGKAAAPLARMGAQALGAGAVNKAQGGDFKTGAMMGGATGAVGEGLRTMAPGLAETSLRIGKPDRIRGRQIGQAVLDHTKGFLPETVGKSAGEKIGTLESDALAQSDPNAAMSLLPVRAAARQGMGKLEGENVPSVIEAGRGLEDLVHTRYATGEPIPDELPLSEALPLRRGLGKYLAPGTWNPETSSRIAPLRNQMYGAMNEQIGQHFPAIRAADEQIKSLIPVVRAGESASRNAGIGQRIAGRMAAHTGALAGGVGAGILGYEKGGPTKALEYGLTGLALPELLASPGTQMVAARALHSGLPATAARGLIGGSMSAKRQDQ